MQAAGWGSAIKGVDGNTFELHFQEGRTNAVTPDTKLMTRYEQSTSDGLACG